MKVSCSCGSASAFAGLGICGVCPSLRRYSHSPSAPARPAGPFSPRSTRPPSRSSTPRPVLGRRLQRFPELLALLGGEQRPLRVAGGSVPAVPEPLGPVLAVAAGELAHPPLAVAGDLGHLADGLLAARQRQPRDLVVAALHGVLGLAVGALQLLGRRAPFLLLTCIQCSEVYTRKRYNWYTVGVRHQESF